MALAFYVLLAPIALWFGVTLLVIRLLGALLVRSTRPGRSRPLTGWATTTLRWLGRRPARTGATLVLGALAIAFGTNVVTFAATYQAARQADSTAAFGADLRLTPTGDAQNPPPLGPAVAATSPVRIVPARVGTDRKSIMAIDIASYRQAATATPRMLAGPGLAALVEDPKAVLVASEIADGFSVGPGDTLTMTIFPDDQKTTGQPGSDGQQAGNGQYRTRNLNLRVAGVFRSFPPTDPVTELVTTTAAIPQPLPAPDLYLARAAPGESADPGRGGGARSGRRLHRRHHRRLPAPRAARIGVHDRCRVPERGCRTREDQRDNRVSPLGHVHRYFTGRVLRDTAVVGSAGCGRRSEVAHSARPSSCGTAVRWQAACGRARRRRRQPIRSARDTMIPSGPRTYAMRQTCSY